MPTRKYGYDDAEIYRPGEQTPAERRQNPVGHLAEEAAFQGLSVNPLVHLADSLRGIHLKGRIGGLQLAKQAYDVRAKAIRSMNDVALAREEAALVPLKIEHEKQLIEHDSVRANVAMNVFLHDQEQQVQIADREHKIRLKDLEADMLYARARKRDAKRALKDAGKKRQQAERSGDMPAEYRRYSEMEATAKRNVAAAQRDIADIIARAQSEGRSVSELTPEEIEEIDARRAAGAAAANEVRRRAASDF